MLGIVTDYNVWADYIDQLCKKLSKITFALRVIRNATGSEALKSVYFAHFQSILMYGIEYWGQASGYLTKRTFKLQKQSVRIIGCRSGREICQKLFKQLCILPLPAALYILQIFVFLKKKNTWNMLRQLTAIILDTDIHDTLHIIET